MIPLAKKWEPSPKYCASRNKLDSGCEERVWRENQMWILAKTSLVCVDIHQGSRPKHKKPFFYLDTDWWKTDWFVPCHWNPLCRRWKNKTGDRKRLYVFWPSDLNRKFGQGTLLNPKNTNPSRQIMGVCWLGGAGPEFTTLTQGSLAQYLIFCRVL